MTVVATAEVRGNSNLGAVISKDAGAAASSLKQLQGIARATFAGGALAGAISFTGQMIQLGTEIQRMNNALNTLSAGQADQYIAAIKRETNGLVSEASAAGIATNLLGLKIVNTADEAAEFARIAAILGGTFRGLGAEQAAQEMSLLFSNMSLLRLDTFGISAAKVRARIQELQEATPGLTREVAFQQAAMEEARKSADQLSGALTDQGAEIERTRVLWQDFKGTVGVGVANAFFDVVGPVLETTSAVRGLREETDLGTTGFEKYRERILASGVSLRGHTQEHLDLAEAQAKAQDRLEQAAKAPERMAISQLQMAKATQQTTYDLERQAEVVKAAQEAQQHLADTQRDSFSTVQALTDGWQASSVVGQQLISDLGGMKVPAGELANLQREIAVQTGLATPEQNAQAEALDRAKLAFEQGRISAQGLLDVYLAIPQGVQAANEALSTGLDEQKEAQTFAVEPKDYYDARPAIQQTEALTSALEGVGGVSREQFAQLDDSVASSASNINDELIPPLNTAIDLIKSMSNIDFYGHIGIIAPGFQHGGQFTVRGSGGADSVPVSFMATPGETVTVTPRGQSAETGGVVEEHHFHISGPVNLYPQGRTGIADALNELGIMVAPL